MWCWLVGPALGPATVAAASCSYNCLACCRALPYPICLHALLRACLPHNPSARQRSAGRRQRRRTTSTSATPLSSSMRSGKVSSGLFATGRRTLGVPEALSGYSLEPPPPARRTAVTGGSCSIDMAVGADAGGVADVMDRLGMRGTPNVGCGVGLRSGSGWECSGASGAIRLRRWPHQELNPVLRGPAGPPLLRPAGAITNAGSA